MDDRIHPTRSPSRAKETPLGPTPPEGYRTDRSMGGPIPGETKLGDVYSLDTRPTHNGDRHLIRTKNLAFFHIQLVRIPTYADTGVQSTPL